MKCIFMHDNAPGHAFRLTTGFLASKNFKEDRLIEYYLKTHRDTCFDGNSHCNFTEKSSVNSQRKPYCVYDPKILRFMLDYNRIFLRYL